jgi:hypothetical protein
MIISKKRILVEDYLDMIPMASPFLNSDLRNTFTDKNH